MYEKCHINKVSLPSDYTAHLCLFFSTSPFALTIIRLFTPVVLSTGPKAEPQLFLSFLPGQEIDGKSLLLMTRNDVLTGLSIKLGPALKIYEYHVKPLQTQHLKSNAS